MSITNPMSQQELFDLLAGVTGHFEITSPQDEHSIQSLQETLGSILSGEDFTTVKNSFFSPELFHVRVGGGLL